MLNSTIDFNLRPNYIFHTKGIVNIFLQMKSRFVSAGLMVMFALYRYVCLYSEWVTYKTITAIKCIQRYCTDIHVLKTGKVVAFENFQMVG